LVCHVRRRWVLARWKLIVVVTLCPVGRDAAVDAPLEEVAVGYWPRTQRSAGCRWWMRGRRLSIPRQSGGARVIMADPRLPVSTALNRAA
jgi:hypothetical protein